MTMRSRFKTLLPGLTLFLLIYNGIGVFHYAERGLSYWFLLMVVPFLVLYYILIKVIFKTWDVIALRASAGVFLLLFYFLLYILGDAAIHVQLVLSFLLSMSFVVLYVHLDSVEFHITAVQSKDRYHHPFGGVLTVNNSLIAVFISIFALIAVMGHMPLVWVFRRIAALVSGFFNMLSMFVQRFATEDIAFPELAFIFEYGETELYDTAIPEGEVGGAFEFGLGWSIYAYVILFISIALIGLTLFHVIRMFYRNSKHLVQGENANKDSTTVGLERTFLSDLRSLLPKLSSLPRHPVRRAYVKKVRKHISGGVDVVISDTTDIIADKIRSKENIDELTSRYERVRYGRE